MAEVCALCWVYSEEGAWGAARGRGPQAALKGWAGAHQVQSRRKDWLGRGNGKVKDTDLGRRSHSMGPSTEVQGDGMGVWLGMKPGDGGSLMPP